MNKKIKLSLLLSLIASSTLAITLPIVSCSSSTELEEEQIVTNKTLFVNESDLETAQSFITNLLKDELSFAKTNQAQKNIVNEWKELPTASIVAIKNTLNFKNTDGINFSGMDVIENIVFSNKGSVPGPGGNIQGPELQVVLKSEYNSTSDILIQVGSLGKALGDIFPENDSNGNFDRAIRKLQENFVNEFRNLKTRDEQQAFLNSCAKDSEIKSSYQDEFKKNLLFTVDTNIYTANQVIKSITFNSEPKTLPGQGAIVFAPQLKINLKPQFAPNKDILFFSTTVIGIAL
ncbi:MAG: hypothetical protein ACRDCD_02790 [Mycoplasmoidaceae bacterium]